MKQRSISALAPVLLLFLSQIAYTQGRLAIPSYVSPDSRDWSTWQALGPQAVGMMVVNLNNGDEVEFRASAFSGVQRARDAGILVLGYVHTAYGKRDPGELRSKIDAAFKNYHVDGIFFDETPSECTAANKFAGTNLLYYEDLANYVHRTKTDRSITALNPGVTPPDDCWMKITDILLTFEGPTLANYQQQYVSEAWTHNYAPERFWHLIYSVNSASDMQAAVALARQRGVGWLYVTDDGADGNPWDRVPAYMEEEATAWTGHAAQPGNTAVEATPRRVSIRWRAPKKARSQILIDVDQKSSTGFHGPGVAVGADLVIELPGDGSASLMRYTGAGTDWKWVPVAAHATLLSPEPGVNIVQFDADPLGTAATVKVQFRLLDNDWTPVYTSDPVKWRVSGGK